ncbi:uncharacterized protein LOC117615778 [Prunus dulcis]|uniref:uncharacterized protein LOC117615778 n=1 Tax=Prunus dulcis TaxID=3755 RepID=UPI00148290A2|nr:uncharacterized protein LOC117615778 [Prunus dulcis]
MSSPKTYAKSSSSSRSPVYLTGDEVDRHAIEVRSKLHPYVQKNLDENVLHLFENTLVLGPHWFGFVPEEMADLFKEDAEASPEAWSLWKKAGIFDAILLSKHSVNRDGNLLAAALCFWNSASNTFGFRMGSISPTLLDLAQIFGFRPHGWPADAVGDCHIGKNRERLAKPFTIHAATINQNCSFSNFLKKFSTEKDRDQQHMLFLLYWLNKFIFPNCSSAVLLEYKHLEEALHNHADVGLGPIVLAHLYKNLHSATLENPLNISAPSAFWMIQICLHVYFLELRFPDIVLPEDQVMAVPLMWAEVPKR